MRTIDITPEAAEDALVRLTKHIPADIEIGRVLAAYPAEDGVAFIADCLQVWWSHHGRGVRYIETSGGLAELTEWAWRVEVSRTVVPTE